jgi:GNAT superfamily N-acetyltransferase
MGPELRPAAVTDAPAIAELTLAGFETYRSFAGAGWDPPAETAAATAQRLAGEGAWGLVAVSGGHVVGFAAYEPARDGFGGPLIGGLAHVWAVHAAAPYWGTGLAATLLGIATAAIAEEGYPEARLHTPAGQQRARRFYAREGWAEAGGPFLAPELGLELVELRRPV